VQIKNTSIKIRQRGVTGLHWNALKTISGRLPRQLKVKTEHEEYKFEMIFSQIGNNGIEA